MIGSVIDEIKNRLDVVEVIGQYIKLQKSGANYKAPCPFHSEKKGSFFVSQTKQIWHCFGCQRGGDIFGFVKEIEGVEFGDALRILANKAGVELQKQTPEAALIRSEREKFYEECELAAKFFEKQIEASGAGREAKKYLLSRGLSEASVKEWRVGYAPDSWHGLSNFLAASGYQNNEIEKAGLAVRSEIGSVHDRFRGRIMFPIFDFNSQVVGFGGRIFRPKKDDEAKYINTPNTILYDKSRILYGLDRAKIEIKKKNACVLVEGYTDVIMSFQAGFTNVVSTSGTALTPFQLKIMKRYTDNLVLGYDMDLAGDTANKRGIDLAQAQGFNVKVVRPPYEGKDPADVIAQDPGEWEKALKSPKSIQEFYFENAFASNDKKTIEGKKAIAKILLPSVKRIDNQVEQTYWLQKMARDLGVREDDLRAEMKKIKLEEVYDERETDGAPDVVKKTHNELVEERLLVLILKCAKNIELVGDAHIPFFSDKGREILSATRANPGEVEKSLSPEIKDYYSLLFLRSEIEEADEASLADEIRFYCCEIEEILLKSKLEDSAEKIKKAEAGGDHEAAGKLKEDYNSLAKSIGSLEKNREP